MGMSVWNKSLFPKLDTSNGDEPLKWTEKT